MAHFITSLWKEKQNPRIIALVFSIAVITTIIPFYAFSIRRDSGPHNHSLTSGTPFSPSLLHFLNLIGFHERRVYSQNMEDGILEFIFDNIGTTNKYYVEFGTENAVQCNTRLLWERDAWDGLLLDSAGVSTDTRVIRNHFITVASIVPLFKQYSVPEDFDLLSLDIDFNDYYVTNAILQSGYRPRVIVVEVNRNWGPHESKTVRYKSHHVRERGCVSYWGMSQLAACRLMNRYGYVAVYTESQAVNSFFIHKEALLAYLSFKGVDATWEFVQPHMPTWESIYRREANTHCGSGPVRMVEFLAKEDWIDVKEDGTLSEYVSLADVISPPSVKNSPVNGTVPNIL